MHRKWILGSVGMAVLVGTTCWISVLMSRQSKPIPLAVPSAQAVTSRLPMNRPAIASSNAEQFTSKPAAEDSRPAASEEELDALPNLLACKNGEKCGDCRSDADCPKGAACLVDPKTRLNVCMTSECKTDRDCPERTACRVVGDDHVNPVMRCWVIGDRQLGEPCHPEINERRAACAEDLLCGPLGLCEPPCDPTRPSSCPKGSTCSLRTEQGFFCRPSCESTGCPEGQKCIYYGWGSTCGKQVGENCLLRPCAEGKTCIHSSPQAFFIRFECVQPCDPKASQCLDGQVCVHVGLQTVCAKACDPQDLESCPTEKRCNNSSSDGPDIWACRF